MISWRKSFRYLFVKCLIRRRFLIKGDQSTYTCSSVKMEDAEKVVDLDLSCKSLHHVLVEYGDRDNRRLLIHKLGLGLGLGLVLTLTRTLTQA